MRKRRAFQQFWPLIVLLAFYGCTAMSKGDFRLQAGMPEAAIPYYQQHLSENPDDWKAHRNLGIAYYKSGQPENALKELTIASEASPNDQETVYYLGLAESAAGDSLKAAKTLRGFYHPDETVQKKVDQSVTLLEIKGGLDWAKEALDEEAKLQTTPPQPNSIAVCYYKDLSSDNQFRYLQKAMTEMIISDLAKVKTLSVVERVRVQYLLEEMEMGRTGIVDQSTAPRTGSLLGAEHLVIGTLDSGSIVSKTGMASTTKKTVVAAFSLTEDHGDFFQLQKKIVHNILRIINVTPTPIEREQVDEEHTRSFQAVVHYGHALDAQDRGDWKEAKKYYCLALQEDPNFKLAFWGSQSCPDGDAPGIGALGGMSAAEMSAYVDTVISNAISRNEYEAQRKLETEVNDPPGHSEAGPGPSPGPGRGDISVSW